MTNRNLAFALASAVSLAALSLAATSEGQVTQKPPPQAAKVAAKADLTLGPSLNAWRDGVHSEATRRELSIGNLEISVDVRGDIAETTVTASFDNPSNDQLEGNFQLNMARNAVVTGYALDINGTLIDGVLESKYKAAEAYQRRVNRRIDPGLAEVDYSDRFETRIYPIPAKGSRIIRLRMVSQFDPAEGYVLPLTIPGKVKHLSMKVSGEVKVAATPVAFPSGQTAIQLEDATLKGALKLTAVERPSPMLVSQHPGAESFFDILAPAPGAAATWRHPLHIFWDRSVSRADDELTKEAQLAEDYAQKRGVRRVKLTMFDSGKIDTIDVDADRISETLAAIHYRGGTSYAMLASLVPSMVMPAAQADTECLMFSDGRVSMDDRTNFSLPCAISTVTSGPESDRAWLSDLSERTGGVALTLTKSNSTDVLAQLMKPDARIIGVTDGSGHALETVRIAADPRNFHIVGPMPDDGVVVVKIAGESTPRRFTSTSSRTPVFAGPGALWARQRLGVEASERKPDELAAMARKYNVATPQASFVVLESPQDYVQAKIAPPANYPKQLQASYASMKASAESSLGKAKEARLTQVVSIWNDEKKWWATKFTGKPIQGSEKDGGRADGFTAAEAPATANMALPSPPPPPPPRPAMSAPASARADQDRVVVTGSMIGGGSADAKAADDEAEASGPSNDRAGSITVADWSANRPYLDRLDKAGANWEAQIDKEMPKEGSIPLFWFDIAEWHWRAGRKEEARRAAEAALDLPTRDSQTLQIAAQRLLRYGGYDRAIWLLEKLMDAETDRPQPMRALANALIERAKYAKTSDASRADLGRAIQLLAKVATGVFEEQPARGVETVALMEANNALAKLKSMGGTSTTLDPRLVALLDTDVRVVMEWNTPRTDLDLWVTEPKGARVGYSSPLSSWGGKLSGDVTNGYGPEEYLIRVANAGTYDVRAKTFASDRSNPNGPSTLTVHLIRNWGRPGQSEQVIDMEMPAEDRGELAVGKFKIE